jgi:hypothetical protein
MLLPAWPALSSNMCFATTLPAPPAPPAMQFDKVLSCVEDLDRGEQQGFKQQ